ncbi:MAG: hypothetical protein ACI9CE_000740 [Flavobacterium sp.]|jgi:hypothetical protein
MTQILKISSFILLLSTLAGCVVAIGNDGYDDGEDGWEHRQEKNLRYINGLDLGTSMNVVEADLGTPDFSDSFQRDGEVFNVIYYRTQHRESDGETSRDETTPLVFIGKSLVGWGELAIEQANNR